MSKTIDQLPEAAALTGAETLPVNQAGITKHANISMIQAFIATLFEAAGAVASGMAGHLAAYVHGDIAHNNRAALDVVSGVNTGDQDLSGIALKTDLPVSSATPPGSTYPAQIWYNTTDYSIMQRNSSNTGWVFKGFLDNATNGLSGVTITRSGNWAVYFVLILRNVTAVQLPDNSLINSPGKWVEILIYNESAAPNGVSSLSFDDLTGTYGQCTVSYCSALLSLLFPELQFCQGLTASNHPVLTAFSAPKLRYISGPFSANSNPVLPALILPLLETIEQTMAIQADTALSTISMPALIRVGMSVMIDSNPQLTNVSLPMLVSVFGTLQISICTQLTSISLASLASIGSSIIIYNLPALISISFPALITCGAWSLTSVTAALTSITIGATLKKVTGNVLITSAALTQTSVDHILARLAALDGTNGTTAYSSKIVTLTGTSATPSAAGLASKATLVARGCTVTHN